MTKEEAIKVLEAEKKFLFHGSLSDKHYEPAFDMAIEALSDVPDTNVGKWIYSYTDMICPVCNASFDGEIIYMCENGKMNFCPNCGARMECGGEE